MNVNSATSDNKDLKKIDLLSILDSCRTCMAKNTGMIAIFDKTCKNILEEIMFCTGVTLTEEDNLPKKICIKCLNNLSIAHMFKTSCLLADKTFHNLLDENFKCEQTEIGDVDFHDAVEFKDEFDDEFFDDKIKNEPELLVENELNQRTTRVRRIKPITTAVSKMPKKPRRLMKFKFKKLHCESCDIKFDNKQQCTEHKKEFHKDNEHWVCEICGKLFIHRASHYTHIRSHMPPKYSCHQCDYRTSHKHDLVKHIRTHTGVKMYQCEYCTASYYTSSNLTGHIRRHHIKERPFSCNLCNLSFFDRTKLNRHMDSHNEIKRFACEVCHACFTRRCHWKKHLLKQHDIITPPQRPGRQKTNAIVGENLIDNNMKTYTASASHVNTESETNRIRKINNGKRKDLHQKQDIISEGTHQKQDIISEGTHQKHDIREDLNQNGDHHMISEELNQKVDVKINLSSVAEFLILKTNKEF